VKREAIILDEHDLVRAPGVKREAIILDERDLVGAPGLNDTGCLISPHPMTLLLQAQFLSLDGFGAARGGATFPVSSPFPSVAVTPAFFDRLRSSGGELRRAPLSVNPRG
jgi:hypothetical protein